jgi:hypothetical protein
VPMEAARRAFEDAQIRMSRSGGGVDHELRTRGVTDVGGHSRVLRTQTPHVGGRYRRDRCVGMLDVGATVLVFPHTCENVVG